MIRTRKRMGLCIAWLCLNLLLIWGNSLLPGEISLAVSNWVKGLLAGLFPAGASSGGTGFLIRKLAHFTEFFLLGLCLCWLFGMLKKKKITPILWGASVACVDETIQRFIPDRSSALRDVGIDTCGVILGVCLLSWGYARMRKRKQQFGG